MKLKYTFLLKTAAQDPDHDPSNARRVAFEDCEVELLFSEHHRVEALAVYLPKVRLPQKDGKFYVPSFERHAARAHAMATFFANLLYVQTGEGELLRASAPPRFLADTKEEGAFLKTYLSASFAMPVEWTSSAAEYDLQPETIERYRKVANPLIMYADACRLTDPISKFREFYRALEYFFPGFSPGRKEQFDTAAATYLSGLDQLFTETKIRRFRVLRDKCSHAQGKFITSAHLPALGRVRQELPTLQQAVQLLLRNPPPRSSSAKRFARRR